MGCLQEERCLSVVLALVISCLTLAVVYGMRLPFLLAVLGTAIEGQRHRSRLVVVWIRSKLRVSRRRLRARIQGLGLRIQCTGRGVSKAHERWRQD